MAPLDIFVVIAVSINSGILKSRLPTGSFPCAEMSSVSREGNMADTSKDGLLLGGRICHVTAMSQFMFGSKQVPACVHNLV